MKTILVTGATRGLGLAFAEALSKLDDVELILGVRDLEAGRRVASDLRGRVQVAKLDMASRTSISRFVSTWDRPLYGLINNAGLQNVGDTSFSKDGDELTLAVNHLGPYLLIRGLLPYMQGGCVLGVGSGTHNPEDKDAARFGFRGGRFSSIAALAQGETDAQTQRQAGFDRYATSKLLAMAVVPEMARCVPATRFVTLDPGLMPGTGLVRSAPAVVRFVWRAVLPLLVPLMSGASTPQASAAAGLTLLLDPELGQSGGTYHYDAKPSAGVWSKVNDPEFGRIVLEQTDAHLGLDPVGGLRRAS